jgi:outer membrane protein OmpA-like peptidoglycan-associated protein
MERIKPMLGDVELQQVQQLNIDADQILTEHEIPALEGNFYQQEGRRGTLITVSGLLSGVSVEEDDEQNPATGLKALREKFKAAEPLSFVSDIMSATDIDEVLIEEMEVTEIAGKPNRFEYAFTLREFTAAPSNPTEPPEIIPPVITETATLIVEVIVVANSAFDFSRVSVTVRGTKSDGTDLFRTLTNRNNNIWTEEDFPPGQYTCEAVVLDTPQMTGNVQAEVRDGETTSVSIVLRSDVKIAQTFMIHYRFDSAFVEPCMLDVLQQISEFSRANSDLKLLILGHTDLVGSTSYNQALSERRARSPFSALRFADDNQAAIDEWNEIRSVRVSGASLGDSWGAREYQQMLQELGLYTGTINGNHDSATDTAVREFQQQNGLNDDGDMGDLTWPVLIREYLLLKNLSIPDNQFLPNCPGEVLKWLGCSELDPVRDVAFAWRPNRRTEFVFIQDDSLPSDVVQPDTFNKPSAGAVNSAWCLNDSGVSSRCCFVKPHVGAGKESCSPTRDPWPREAAEPAPVFVVKGSIKFEDGTPFVGQYTLIAPDGEFMDGEVPRTSGSLRAGTGIKGTTEADGSFEYPDADKHKRPGIFTLEVTGEVVVRGDEQPLEEAKGPFACKRLASDQDSFDVIIVPAALANIMPSIAALPTIVVKRQHTNPQRQPVVLSVNQTFTGTGTFTRSPDDKVLFFTAATGGTALQFDGNDNLFTDVQLFAGVTLFSEGGPNPSDVLDDITLTLQIVVSGQNGRSTSEQMTSVLISLNISAPQTDTNTAPPFLTDIIKVSPGRFVLPQNATFDRPRAILTVMPSQPLIPNDLQLNLINGQLRLFPMEDPRSPIPPQAPLPNPLTLTGASIPATGSQFFIEATGVSSSFRDTGLQRGIAAMDPDGDRVLLTA